MIATTSYIHAVPFPVQLLPADPSRLRAIISNDSTADLHLGQWVRDYRQARRWHWLPYPQVKIWGTYWSSTVDPAMVGGSYYELDYSYTGSLYGWWSASSGKAHVVSYSKSDEDSPASTN